MKTEAEPVIERANPAPFTRTAPVPATTLKTFLAHIQNDSWLDRRIEAALSLARASSAHLSCLHVTPIEAYVAFDSFGGVFVMDDVIRTLDEEDARLRSRIEAKLMSEDVSWDYVRCTGNMVAMIAGRAALADLVVAGRAPQKDEFAAPATGLLGDLLLRSRTPVFIPGDDPALVDPSGTAVIAWDGSYEAANAVRSSLGLLALASSVSVVQVAERKDDAFPGTKLLEYLSRQGVHAEFTVTRAPADGSGHEAVAAELVAHARNAGAAYMVMGGYSHSRLGELVFGGVTRALLKECPVSLVVTH